ncbi:zinc finger, C3HC4 type (RING finger) protein [Medicago truncatula]|uniref:RING-type E3 ubiquitin transferase (cysteine targeting) n=1 Tax=Medicago truncatula TaxID=3880 RepID=A0A072TXE4_MEDTR|nr:zinc finger, C3HC4 type (RING finger) protein [Medicago truncatula]
MNDEEEDEEGWRLMKKKKGEIGNPKIFPFPPTGFGFRLPKKGVAKDKKEPLEEVRIVKIGFSHINRFVNSVEQQPDHSNLPCLSGAWTQHIFLPHSIHLHLHLPPMSSTTLPSVPPQDAWTLTSHKLLPRWISLSHQSTIPISISRVNQVDAARLDIEMSAMLKEQLVKVFTLMKPGMLFQYEAELDAFLEFLIWRFSIWVDKPTPGIALMNLRYRDERAVESRDKVRTGLEGPGLTVAQKLWYCIATVGGQYIWARLQSFSAFRRWGDTEQRPLARRLWILIQRIEGIYRAASFGNLLIFLCTGRYRNLIERVLRARLVYGSPNMNRAVSFEYMNRQLVWNEFSVLLLLFIQFLFS